MYECMSVFVCVRVSECVCVCVCVCVCESEEGSVNLLICVLCLQPSKG